MNFNKIVENFQRNGGKLDLEKLNPFYRDYITTFFNCSEASPEFILTSLFSSLGSAISLSRWIEWGTKKIYPNFWTLIIGESTQTRKSTALNIGLYFTKQINNTNHKRSFLLPVRTSMAAFLDVLAEEKNGVVMHDEIATFLKLLRKGFNGDMQSLLTTFFDVPEIYKINYKQSGSTIFERPIFSLATASTPIWLKKNLKKSDSTSGFLARFLFCYQNKKRRNIPIPQQPNPKNTEQLQKVYSKLLKLDKKPISLGKEFEKIYSDFYREIDRLIQGVTIDGGLKSILGRLQTDYFLKFLILESVLSGKLIAGKNEIFRTKYLTGFYAAQAINALKRFAGSEQKDLEDEILKLIKEKGEVERTDFYNYINNLTAQTLNSILSTLIKAELIEKFEKTNKRKVTAYRLNSLN